MGTVGTIALFVFVLIFVAIVLAVGLPDTFTLISVGMLSELTLNTDTNGRERFSS